MKFFIAPPHKKPGQGPGFLLSSPCRKTTSGSVGPASGRLAGHPGLASAGRASARSRPAGCLGSDYSLRYLVEVCVELRRTPADRHTFRQSSSLASAATRIRPLVLIRLDVIRLPTLFGPTIGAALTARYWFVWHIPAIVQRPALPGAISANFAEIWQRLRLNADRNIGFVATVSARALNVASFISLSGFDHRDGLRPTASERARPCRLARRSCGWSRGVDVVAGAGVQRRLPPASVGKARRSLPRSACRWHART